MSVLNAARRIEQRLAKKKLDSVVKFFDSHEAYQEACNSGAIRTSDICFIDDVSDNELDEAINCLEDGQPIPGKIQKKIDHEKSVFNNPATKGQFSYLSDAELKKEIEKHERKIL